MPGTVRSPISDAELVGAILKRIAQDLGMILGHDVSFEGLRLERAITRPAGQGRVHVSFKLAFRSESGVELHGALLVPLPDALTMACFLLMIPAETVARRREETTLDATLKDAMLEIGNLLGEATNTAIEGLGLASWSARAEGCQGVRAGVRPAFPYAEGSELLIGRVTATLAAFPSCELLLLLPALD